MAQISILTGVLLADPTLPALALLMATLSFGRRGQSTLAGVCAAIAVGCGSWTCRRCYAIWIARHGWRVLLVLTVGSSCCSSKVYRWSQRCRFRSISRTSLNASLGTGRSSLARPRWSGELCVEVDPHDSSQGSSYEHAGCPSDPRSARKFGSSSVLLALGVAAVETGPALLLLGLITLGIRLPDIYTPTPEEAGREQVIAAMSGRQGKAMCTTQTFVRASDDGWLRPCVGLDSLATDPTAWRPEDVLSGAKRLGARWVAVENEAVLSRYFNLQPLLEDVLPEGFTRVTSAPGWQVFSLETDPRPEP